LDLQKINDGLTHNKNTSRKKKRKFNKRFFLVKFIFFSILTITTLVLLGLSPLFNITDFEVNGCKHYNKKVIIDATGILTESNGFKSVGSSLTDLFTLRYRNAEKEIINKFSYIKSATVRFTIPNIVTIDIKERKPLCFVNYFGTDVVLDYEGFALQRGKAGIKTALPLIKGLKFDNFKIGQALNIKNIENYIYAKKVISAIIDLDKKNTFKLLDEVNQINVEDLSKVAIFVDSRLNVNLGNLKDLNYKLTFFREILTHGLKKEDKGNLDMTLKEPVLTTD
jgi:cell division protein FtsQ